MPRTFHVDRARLRVVLDRFPDRRVIVLGDVMLDRYLWGRVSRISPEAPVPVVDVDHESVRLGGAANVAANLRTLGAHPVLIGVMGRDRGADELCAELGRSGIESTGLVVDPGRSTTRKTRVVAHHQHVVRVDQEEVRPIDDAGEIIAHVDSALGSADAMVISDYGKGVVTREVLVAVLEHAATRGVPVCVDPKESHFDSYRPVSVITPNLDEAGRAMGRRINADSILEDVGFELLRRLGCPAVLITRGERGMSLFEESGHTHFPAVAQEVFDVTGAGDTVVGTYALALAGGADHALAAAIANHAAGRVIREVGTATTTTDEIQRSFDGAEDAGRAPSTIPAH